MNHTIRCTLLLTLCSLFTSGYGAAFNMSGVQQPGMVDNLVGGINRLRGRKAKNFVLTPQDAFSRLMGDALVKARGKISLEQVSTAEIYFNEVFSHGSPDMQKGLTEMTFILGKELDKVYFSSATKYRTLSNLLREVFSHLRAIAIRDEELAAQKRGTQQTHTFEQRTQVERLFLLYRSLQSVATAVSDGVRQWLGRLPWVKMLLGAGAVYGGVKLYKNKTIPKMWEMAKSAKAFFDTGTTMMREQERQQRAFFEEHAEIDWVATINNANERDASQLNEKYEVHVVKYKKPQTDQEEGRFEYLIKQASLPAGYPADFENKIRTAYRNSKNISRTDQQRGEDEARVQQLLTQWKQRIHDYKMAAAADRWIHLPPSTIDRLVSAGKTLAPIIKETTHLLRQNRVQQEAWYVDNNIASEMINGEKRHAMRSTLKVLSKAEERHFYREAKRSWHEQNPGQVATHDQILRVMGPLVLKNENSYEMRYVQLNQINAGDINLIRQSLQRSGRSGGYYNEAGGLVVPTVYARQLSDGFIGENPAAINQQGAHRTLLPIRNIVEQALNRVFDPLGDRESAMGGVLHEAHVLMERNRIDSEEWLKGINPVYTDQQQTQPMTGWPRPGDAEYEAYKGRQYFVGREPSSIPHSVSAADGQQYYRHYPSENVLKGLTDAVHNINRDDVPVGDFLRKLGSVLEAQGQHTLANIAPYLEKDATGRPLQPLRLKPNVRKKKIHAPGTEYHQRYYWVFVDDAGNELVSEGGALAPADGRHHAGRYIEDIAINGLWEALASLSNSRGTDMSKLLGVADGIVGPLRADDPREAHKMGVNINRIAKGAGIKVSGYGVSVTFDDSQPLVDFTRIPEALPDEPIAAYQGRLEARQKEIIREKRAIKKPRGLLLTSSRKDEYNAKKEQERGLGALIRHLALIINKIKRYRSEHGDGQTMTPEITEQLLASPSSARAGAGGSSVSSGRSDAGSVADGGDGLPGAGVGPMRTP